jgi:hypothetical protein
MGMSWNFNLYSSKDKLKDDEVTGTCSMHERGEICFYIFSLKTEVKGPLVRPGANVRIILKM